MIDADTAIYGTMFRKHYKYQQMIQYAGAARDLVATKLGEAVKESGGVRFYKKYEQIQQISAYSPPKLLTDVIIECVNRKWSERSSSKLLSLFGGG